MSKRNDEEDQEEQTDLRSLVMAQRKAIVAKLEKKRKSKVITLIHRREPWVGEEENGDEESITLEDSEFVLMEISRTPKDQPIDFIVHTPGGLALAAEMISIALKNHPGKTTVMVPFYAMSGGTLIALAADEILMENYAVLGPVDPQFNGYPAAAYTTLLQEKPLQAVQDEVVLMTHVARLAVGQVKNFVKWLLGDRLSAKKCEELANFLTGGYITHDTPITLTTVRDWGLNIHEGVPPEVFELFTTCEFGLCKRPCLASYG